MGHFELSEQAASDLEAIYIYTLVHFGDNQADTYFKNLDKQFTYLAQHPELGSLYTDIQPSYRRYVYQRHAIYYRVMPNSVFIARLLHTKQDPGRHLL
ncbi:MAG: type II toxin-antitoxin system RelE/ParE family toxin [Hydrogenovibrio sp.]